MDTITYTRARSRLAETMERVCEDHAPVIITKKDESVVMMSLADYQSMEETAYLCAAPGTHAACRSGLRHWNPVVANHASWPAEPACS